MSTIAIAPRQVAASRVAAASSGVASALSDTADVAWRNLLTQLRTPQALVFATIQPVIFVLLSATRSTARSTSLARTTWTS